MFNTTQTIPRFDNHYMILESCINPQMSKGSNTFSSLSKKNRVACGETMAITPDSRLLYTSDVRGYLKVWSLPDIKLVKNFGRVTEGY